jgi:uncharacterized membrane protein
LPVFLVIIIFSLVTYVYFKIKYFQSKSVAERKWLSAKSSIALGLFVSFFGLNRMFISQTPLTITIGIIFIIIGGLSIYTGVKAYRFYLPHVLKEREQL